METQSEIKYKYKNKIALEGADRAVTVQIFAGRAIMKDDRLGSV
jgi:hypothetical protein